MNAASEPSAPVAATAEGTGEGTIDDRASLPPGGLRWWAQIPQPSRLMWVAVGLGLGHGLQQLYPQGSLAWLVWLGLGLLLFAAVYQHTNRRYHWLGMGVMVIIWGGWWSHWRAPEPQSGIGPWLRQTAAADGLVRIRGWVEAIQDEPRPHFRDPLETFTLSQPARRWHVQVEAYQTQQGWQPSHGRVIVSLEVDHSPTAASSGIQTHQNEVDHLEKDSAAPASIDDSSQELRLQIGQPIELLGIARWPAAPTNPGQFDRPWQWTLEGIHGEVTCNDPAVIRPLTANSPRSAWPQRVRDHFKQSLRTHVGDTQYPLAAAILLGDRSMLDSGLRQQYAATGTVHILAISGLHLGILAAALLWVGRLGIVPPAVVLWGVIALVLGYAWLVEFRPPMVRAAVLTTAMCVATLLGRRAFTLHSLAVGAIAVFLIQPHLLSQPGTQLSFLAVAAIMTWARHRRPTEPNPVAELVERQRPDWQQRVGRFALAIKDAYTCGAAIFLACLPLVVHHFHLIAWIGLLINPIVVIPMALALFCGLGILVTAPWFPMLADAFGWACTLNLEVMHHCVDYSSKIPGSHIWATSPGWFWVLLWYVWWAAGLWLGHGNLRLRHLAWGGLLIAILAYCWPLPRYPDRCDETAARGAATTILCLDVGHGNATVIRTPENKVIVLDAGSFPSARSAGNKVSEALLTHGIQKIDQLVISHADFDHYNGVPELLRRFPIRQVTTPPQMHQDESPFIDYIFKIINEKKIPIQIAQAGTLLHTEPGLRLETLSPPRPGFTDGDNSNSLVLRLIYGQSQFLFTADLEGQGLQRLLDTPPSRWRGLHVPHHGSAGSRPQAFAQWAQPEIAIISGSQRRIATATREAYEGIGADVRIPNRDGAILVTLFQQGPPVVRGFLSKPWPIR